MVVLVSTFNELKSALSSCSGNTISANTTVELTSDIVVTETLRIGKGHENLTVRSSSGNVFKLTPGTTFRDSFITIGSTFCSSSGSIDNLVIKDIEFSGVTQIQGGITLGPVYVGSVDAGSTITFDGVKWKDNTCPETGALSPTGLRIDAGDVTIRDCLFDNNNAVGISGGALFTGGDSVVTVSDTVFSNNGDDPGDGPSLGGGAAYIKGEASFTSCSFTNNGAQSKGGAIVMDASSSKNASFTSCTFSGNTATSGGNDFYIKKSGHTITYTPCTTAPDCTADAGSCPCSGSGGSDGSGGSGGSDANDIINNAVNAVVALGTGIIVGIAVGGAVVLGLLILMCYCCCCRKKNQQVVIVQQSGKPGTDPASESA